MIRLDREHDVELTSREIGVARDERGLGGLERGCDGVRGAGHEREPELGRGGVVGDGRSEIVGEEGVVAVVGQLSVALPVLVRPRVDVEIGQTVLERQQVREQAFGLGLERRFFLGCERR
jgi:hypothetical protein